MKEAASAFKALAATAFWCGMTYVALLTLWPPALFFGGVIFLLLLWGMEASEGPPSLFAWLATALSAIYGYSSLIAFGFAAYVESHGCATAPETCTDEGIDLVWQVLICSTLFYFAAAWLVVRIRAGRGSKAAP